VPIRRVGAAALRSARGAAVRRGRCCGGRPRGWPLLRCRRRVRRPVGVPHTDRGGQGRHLRPAGGVPHDAGGRIGHQRTHCAAVERRRSAPSPRWRLAPPSPRLGLFTEPRRWSRGGVVGGLLSGGGCRAVGCRCRPARMGRAFLPCGRRRPRPPLRGGSMGRPRRASLQSRHAPATQAAAAARRVLARPRRRAACRATCGAAAAASSFVTATGNWRPRSAPPPAASRSPATLRATADPGRRRWFGRPDFLWLRAPTKCRDVGRPCRWVLRRRRLPVGSPPAGHGGRRVACLTAMRRGERRPGHPFGQVAARGGG